MLLSIILVLSREHGTSCKPLIPSRLMRGCLVLRMQTPIGAMSKHQMLAGHDKIRVQVILKFFTFLFFIRFFYIVRWIFTYITKTRAP